MNILKNLFQFSVAAIIIICFAGTAPSDERLNGVLGGILKVYGGLPGLTVSYQREIITKSMAMLGDEMKSDIAAGRFLFKPPHYLKVEQDTPEREIVTTEDKSIWWYIPAKKLVYQYPADKLGKELRLLSELFMGLNNAADTFNITLSESEGDEKYDLELKPKEPWEDINHIILSVDRDDLNIKVVEIHNFIGGVTRFRLGEFSGLNDLEKEDFVFVIPEGVEVIKE